MPGKASPRSGFGFLTRKQIADVLQVPQRIVDQWIATGRLTPIRMSIGLGRGGQRVYYSAADVHKLKLARTPPKKRRSRRPVPRAAAVLKKSARDPKQ